VVLLPQLSRAQASGDAKQFSALLDWGLRLVVLLALPSAVALLVFAKPLVAVLYHYGHFNENDVSQTVLALSCYGIGLMGLIGVKVLAPGFYANQVITQVFNAIFVPIFSQAGLALSIGLGSLVNAGWLLIGLRKAGRYQPSPGWFLFSLRAVGATALLGVGLWLASTHIDWIGLRAQPWLRIGALAGCLAGAAIVYFGALLASGLNLKQAFKG
jgi:putative peptidoglycan lipid II flippase